MKKTLIAVAMVATLGLNASAWFDGGLGMTTGPDGYSRTDAYLTIGNDSIWVKPALMRQDADGMEDVLNTYSVRVGKDTALFTVAGEAGVTPEGKIDDTDPTIKYSNTFFGGDITFSLTPSAGGKGRLAGPNARPASGGGDGVARVDIGVGLKHTMHKLDIGTSELESGQTAFSVFSGAKILMLNLGVSWTGYSYGDDDCTAVVNRIDGQAMALPSYGGNLVFLPKSSVNVRLDVPATIPMLSPYASYTVTKYKNSLDDNKAYGVGAYIDLNMVGANVMYQILDNGSAKDSFMMLNAGLKF